MRKAATGAVGDEDIVRCFDSRSLNLILMVTEACNFRCTYCYETFDLGRMQPEVVTGVKRLMTRSAGRLDRLELTWFGGEPLLARDLIEDVMRHAQALARRQPRLAVQSVISTNAYLLPTPVFRHLLDLGVRRFQISFDGDAGQHDRIRVLAGGGPTFDRIWGNLVAMREVEGAFQVLVRLHVNPRNLASARRFIRLVGREFAGDDRFVLFVRPLSRLGGPNDGQIEVLDASERDTVIESLRDLAAEVGKSSYRAEVATPICYAARANSFVVRADGRLNKCTQSLEHPNNQIGRLHADGRLEVDSVLLQPWLRGALNRDAKVLHCPMKGLADMTRALTTVEFRSPQPAVRIA
jgi:uncharacterized protein